MAVTGSILYKFDATIHNYMDCNAEHLTQDDITFGAVVQCKGENKNDIYVTRNKFRCNKKNITITYDDNQLTYNVYNNYFFTDEIDKTKPFLNTIMESTRDPAIETPRTIENYVLNFFSDYEYQSLMQCVNKNQTETALIETFSVVDSGNSVTSNELDQHMLYT